MLYASDSLALAVLEAIVHLAPPATLGDYLCFSLDVPTSQIEQSGDETPPLQDTQTLGSAFLDSRRMIGLEVPSVLLTEGRNAVLNPAHSLWGDVVVSPAKPLTEDARLSALRFHPAVG